MNQPSFTNQHRLFEHLNDGAIVITPNNRLNKQLLNDYFKTQNKPVIEKPLCMPYATFLQYLFKLKGHHQAHEAQPFVLNNLQETYLWRQLLSHYEDMPLQDGLLQEIQSAWTNCSLWQIAMDNPAFSMTEQTLKFQGLRQKFQQKLDTLHAITQDQLANILCHNQALLDKKPVIWISFNEFTPQQNALQQALSLQGCPQHYCDRDTKKSSNHLYAAENPQDERQQLIEWLKLKLAKNVERIGVVVLDLHNQSHSLQRHLLRSIPEESFNLSLGESLYSHPLVAHAITWLHLQSQSLSQETACLLLSSPYLRGSKTEFEARAQLMQHSPLLQESIIEFPAFLANINQSTEKLAQNLGEIIDYPSYATPIEWVKLFKNRLNQLGFPGDYPLDSHSYQYFQRLITLMDELLQLSFCSNSLSQKDALWSLEHLAKTTVFQVQKASSPIQIMGLLEASGCAFDSVWIMGLDQNSLPQKTRLSPFIPISLQKELEMPRSLVDRELQFAKQLLQRLQNGSNECVFSYAKMISDMANLPSSLIPQSELLISYPAPFNPSPSLIEYTQDYTVLIKNDEAIKGGSALLGNQAKCPFRAFAAHRLHASKRSGLSAGLNASERGQTMHTILEKLWLKLGTQKRLLTISKAELDACIQTIILETLSPLSQLRSFSFGPLIKDLELTRLETLVKACLEWEKTRPDFSVCAIEERFLIELGGIEFKVRVDRIDQVGSQKWVIDYKSTLPTTKPWSVERPEEPQLLLYALLDETINALLFLQLKTGALSCEGLSGKQSNIPGIKSIKKDEQWSQFQQNWQQQLSALATEFNQGHCAPQPLRDSLCQSCDFQAVCRMTLNE